jgi:hypothetical protein
MYGWLLSDPLIHLQLFAYQGLYILYTVGCHLCLSISVRGLDSMLHPIYSSSVDTIRIQCFALPNSDGFKQGIFRTKVWETFASTRRIKIQDKPQSL